MPQRPEEHILEDRSVQTFKTRLPDEWIFRRESPDYGIDGNVEIVAGEIVTGRRFHVQLKATGQKGKLSTYIEREAADYYQGLDQPVLIVFYNDCENGLYARWMHSFDPYYGGLSDKSVRFCFTDADRWTSETPDNIKSEVARISAIRRGAYTGPISFCLNITEAEIGGNASVRLRSAFQSIASPLKGIFEIESEPEDALGTIEANSEEIIVRFGTKGVVFHLRGEAVDQRSLAADLAMLIGVVLTQSGKHAKAAIVFSEVAPLCSDPIIRQSGTAILQAMQQSGKVQAAMDLGERLKDRESPPEFAPLLSAIHLVKGSLTTYDKGLIEERLRRQIADFSEKPSEQSRLHYNYGNFLFYEGRYFEAFKQFRRAGDLDPSYWERDYFCQELAGILFECGRYRHSVKYYQRALELGASDWVYPRLADALMFVGKYQEALEIFGEQLENESGQRFEPEWHLQYMVLRFIVEWLGVEEQARNRTRARRIAIPSQDSPDGTYAAWEVPPARFVEALTEDALDIVAWRNLAQSYLGEEEDWKRSTFAFMAAAVIERGNTEVWAQAYLSGVNWITFGDTPILDEMPTSAFDANAMDEPEWPDTADPEELPAEKFALVVLTLIGKTAYQTTGERFVNAVWEQLEAQPDMSPEFLQCVEVVMKQIRDQSKRDWPRKIRFIDEDGDYNELEFPTFA